MMVNSMVLCSLIFHLLLQCVSAVHSYQHLKDNIKLSVNQLENLTTNNNDSGFMMCAGNHMVPDVLKMIWQLKHQWKSQYGISVAHCGEISAENQEVMLLMDPGMHILNLCKTESVLGMSLKKAHHRLRGFYCKVAAVILSPFPNTMLLDLDVVWFQSPDIVFRSKAYQDTGALFFRDRTYPANENHKSDDSVLLNLFHTKGIGLSDEDIYRHTHMNGVSFYWQFIASQLPNGKPFPQMGDLQDSSVVVLNRAKHPRMLAALEEMLPSFDYGYGDKEIFWIAATVANETFLMSPFLAGQYGDCYGVILHYNPDDALQPDLALPLYTNAEYFVEKDTQSAGDFISELRTPPLLAKNMLSVGTNLNTWPGYGKRGLTGCTCRDYPCVPVPSAVNQHMLYAQWVSLAIRLSRAGPDKDCIPVLVQTHHHLADALSAQLKPEHCFFVGCPRLPMKLNTALSWPTSRYCEPVRFDRIEPTGMEELATEARRPNSAYNLPPAKDNTPIQCETDKQIMLYINGTARAFNSWNAFVSRGFDLDNVVRIPRWQCNSVPRGEDIN